MSEPIPCPHWSDCGLAGRGCCAIGKYKNPSRTVCLAVCELGPKRPIAEVMPTPVAKITHQEVRPPPLSRVDGQVVESRRAVCESCPIGSFEGWADRLWTVVRCRECEGCRRRGRESGLIDITVFKCPRGHHEA